MGVTSIDMTIFDVSSVTDGWTTGSQPQRVLNSRCKNSMFSEPSQVKDNRLTHSYTKRKDLGQYRHATSWSTPIWYSDRKFHPHRYPEFKTISESIDNKSGLSPWLCRTTSRSYPPLSFFPVPRQGKELQY